KMAGSLRRRCRPSCRGLGDRSRRSRSAHNCLRATAWLLEVALNREGIGRRAIDYGNCADRPAATFAIRMQYKGDERTTELPLAHDMIGLLAFEAAFRNVTIGELISELIVAGSAASGRRCSDIKSEAPRGKKETALAEHVARHPEDFGRTVED